MTRILLAHSDVNFPTLSFNVCIVSFAPLFKKNAKHHCSTFSFMDITVLQNEVVADATTPKYPVQIVTYALSRAAVSDDAVRFTAAAAPPAITPATAVVSATDMT